MAGYLPPGITTAADIDALPLPQAVKDQLKMSLPQGAPVAPPPDPADSFVPQYLNPNGTPMGPPVPSMASPFITSLVTGGNTEPGNGQPMTSVLPQGPQPPAPTPPVNMELPPQVSMGGPVTDLPPVTVTPGAAPAPPGGGGPLPLAPPTGPAGPPGAPKSFWQQNTNPEKYGIQQDFLGAVGNEGGAKAVQANAIAQGHYAQAQVLEDAAKKQEALEADRQEKEAERTAWSQGKLAEYDKKSDELAKEQIDPNNYWSTRNAAQMLAAGVAMVFGVLGAPATGGVNMGVVEIDKSITRDIEAQKANLASKHAALDKKRGLYADYMSTFNNERMAEAATAASMWKAAQTKVEAMNQMASGDLAKGQGLEALSQIEQKQIAAKDQFFNNAQAAYDAKQKAIAAQNAAIQARVEKERDRKIKLSEELAKSNAETFMKETGKSAEIAYSKAPGSEGLAYAVDVSTGHHIGSYAKVKEGETAVQVVVGTNDEGKAITAPGIAASKNDAEAYNKVALPLMNMKDDLTVIEGKDGTGGLMHKYPNGINPFAASEEERMDYAKAKSAAGRIMAIAKNKQIDTGAVISPDEHVWLEAIAGTGNPLESRFERNAGKTAKGLGVMAGGVAALPLNPLAGITAIGTGAADAYNSYTARPETATFGALRKSIDTQLDNATKLYIAVPPLRKDGTTFQPLPTKAPVADPVK